MPSVTAINPQALLLGLPQDQKAIFFRQLATMVHSGLSVSRSVHTASQQGRRLQQLGRDIAHDIDHGATLSEALSRYPYYFTSYEIAMIKAGEVSGRLDRQLQDIAASIEASWAMHKKVTSKLVYPGIILHAAILLPPLFLLVTDGLDAYLKAVLWLLIPLYVIGGGSVLTYRIFRTLGGPRRIMDHVLSRIAILGPPVRLAARIRLFEALSSLIESGLLPSQAVPLAAESCGNYWLRDKVMTAWEAIGKESSISRVLESSGAFSKVELGLVVAGEEAGQFAPSLKRAATNLIPDFELHVHRLTTLLPVFLLLGVGGIVAAVSIKALAGILAPLSQF